MQQTSENNTRWLDIREATAHLNVSVAFLRKSVRLKTVPFARAGKKILRLGAVTWILGWNQAERVGRLPIARTKAAAPQKSAGLNRQPKAERQGDESPP